MGRRINTDSGGHPFSPTAILWVWNKGTPIPDFDPSIWRRDIFGMPMKYSDYGNVDSKHGWEINHILSVARGGTDELSNLQPLYWGSNRRNGDTYPWSG